MYKSKEIQKNSTRGENFDIYFSVSFDGCYQKLIFGGETGH